MSIPAIPRVLYAQAWRLKRGPDREWHSVSPWSDGAPAMRVERPEPVDADERYEVRVVKYELVMLPGEDE